MKLSVIIPVYNEEKTIREIVEKVQAVPLEKEIIIIDDGSTDQSRAIVEDFRHEEGIKIFHHPKNMGKGSAIRTGIPHTTGDNIIIQDADLELDPNEYPQLIQPIVNGAADVVYGSRELCKENKIASMSFYLGGRFLSSLTNLLYGSSITDEPTCYKVFRANVLKSIPLRAKRFDFCPEVTAKVLKRGYKIVEVPIRYYPRSKKEGKKVRWRDGIEAAITLLKYRFFDDPPAIRANAETKTD